MSAEPCCPNCGAAVPLPLVLCPACRTVGWSDGPSHLTGDELARYLELRRGERQKAPHSWWSGDDGLQRGVALLRWHLQRELGATTREAVLARATLRTLEAARLSRCFSNRERTLSVFDAFQLVFPELALRPWELPGQVPRHFWEPAATKCARRPSAGGWSSSGCRPTRCWPSSKRAPTASSASCARRAWETSPTTTVCAPCST